MLNNRHIGTKYQGKLQRGNLCQRLTLISHRAIITTFYYLDTSKQQSSRKKGGADSQSSPESWGSASWNTSSLFQSISEVYIKSAFILKTPQMKTWLWDIAPLSPCLSVLQYHITPGIIQAALPFRHSVDSSQLLYNTLATTRMLLPLCKRMDYLAASQTTLLLLTILLFSPPPTPPLPNTFHFSNMEGKVKDYFCCYCKLMQWLCIKPHNLVCALLI